jgi:hypothetical protein
VSTESKYKGWGRASRWMGASTAIKNSAFALGLRCEMDVDKGFISETFRFTVTGHDTAVNRFIEWYRSIGAQI